MTPRSISGLVKTKLTACVLLATLAVTGCEKPNEDFANTTASPALWSVENADGETEGWLFGTIHALPDGVEWRTAALESAIDQSASLVLEISPEDQTNLSSIFGDLATTDNLPALLERVSSEDRADLAVLLSKAGYKSSDFTATETWAAALTLARANSSGEYSNGVDVALGAEFGRFLVLEGARNQLSIFDRLPEKEQRDLLNAIIDESAKDTGSDEARLAKIWLDGDMDALTVETSQGMLADPELREALLTKRNTDWVTKIDAWMKRERPMLVAVGAAHMVGDEGLPALLRAKGYQVRRIQ